MKTILLSCVMFLVIVSPVISELIPADLDKIRLVVKDEISKSETELKGEITKSEKRMKDYVDTKFEGVDTKFDSIDKWVNLVVGFVYGLMILVVVTFSVRQVIIALRGRNEREQDRRIEQLTQEIESLKQQRIVNP